MPNSLTPDERFAVDLVRSIFKTTPHYHLKPGDLEARLKDAGWEDDKATGMVDQLQLKKVLVRKPGGGGSLLLSSKIMSMLQPETYSSEMLRLVPTSDGGHGLAYRNGPVSPISEDQAAVLPRILESMDRMAEAAAGMDEFQRVIAELIAIQSDLAKGNGDEGLQRAASMSTIASFIVPYLPSLIQALEVFFLARMAR